MHLSPAEYGKQNISFLFERNVFFTISHLSLCCLRIEISPSLCDIFYHCSTMLQIWLHLLVTFLFKHSCQNEIQQLRKYIVHRTWSSMVIFLILPPYPAPVSRLVIAILKHSSFIFRFSCYINALFFFSPNCYLNSGASSKVGDHSDVPSFMVCYCISSGFSDLYPRFI